MQSCSGLKAYVDNEKGLPSRPCQPTTSPPFLLMLSNLSQLLRVTIVHNIKHPLHRKTSNLARHIPQHAMKTSQQRSEAQEKMVASRVVHMPRLRGLTVVFLGLSLLIVVFLAPCVRSAFAPIGGANSILQRQNKRQHEPRIEFALWQALSSPPSNRAAVASSAAQATTTKSATAAPQEGSRDAPTDTNIASAPNVDAMRARAGVLRRSILKQQIELQQLERDIMCCNNNQKNAYNNELLTISPASWFTFAWNRSLTTFQASSNVLRRKLDRVQTKNGVNNQRWGGSVGTFVAAQTATGVRIVDRLMKNQTQLLHLMVDPKSPLTLVPHVPAIYARLDKLEHHIPPILERVLNDQRHLASVEPYLPEILERFDDIEPHLEWILNHVDILAPYTGLLLKHIDELLPYAQWDEYEGQIIAKSAAKSGRSSGVTGNGTSVGTNGTSYQYVLAEQLLPYLEFYVSRLDTVGPHLPLLRPHVPKLLKHNRVAKMTPHIDRLFALGYKDNLGASANMDVLLFWFGWALRVPGLPRLFFAIPGSPRIVTFLANRLPKRFVRGYCSGVSCTVDGDYGMNWNRLSKS